jgi:ribosomal protein S8
LFSVRRLLNSIRFSCNKNKVSCVVKYTDVMLKFALVLRRGCFIYGFTISGKHIVVYLRYSGRKSFFSKLKFVSKPGGKRYSTYSDGLFKYGHSFGTAAVFSNDMGLFVKNSIFFPGEVICKI